MDLSPAERGCVDLDHLCEVILYGDQPTISKEEVVAFTNVYFLPNPSLEIGSWKFEGDKFYAFLILVTLGVRLFVC